VIYLSVLEPSSAGNFRLSVKNVGKAVYRQGRYWYLALLHSLGKMVSSVFRVLCMTSCIKQ